MLTDEEREQINAAIRMGRGCYESTELAHAAVESIVAARVRAARAQELRDTAEEIYNGAPDPCQAFYNYGLHPWLIDRANHIESSQNG